MGERGRDKDIANINYRHRMWVRVHKLNNNANNLVSTQLSNNNTDNVVKVIHPRDGCLSTHSTVLCILEHNISQCMQTIIYKIQLLFSKSYSSKLVHTPNDPKLATPSALEVIHRMLQ